jgi:hypothetical protein
MGLLDFLTSLFGGGQRIDCPHCGTAGARKTRDEVIQCKNPSCKFFDVKHLPPVPTRGGFVPKQPVFIRYVNFAGQKRDFSAERDSLVRKKNHIVAEVAPTGRKITLSRERIQNLHEVEAYMPKPIDRTGSQPTGRERQILNYHANHGTTSPRYELLRAKYPNW